MNTRKYSGHDTDCRAEAMESAAEESATCDPNAAQQPQAQIEKFVWQEHFDILGRQNGNFKGEPITGGATRFRKHLLCEPSVRACPAIDAALQSKIRSESLAVQRFHAS